MPVKEISLKDGKLHVRDIQALPGLKMPPWKECCQHAKVWFAGLPQATAQQKDFFSRWVREIEQGSYPDLHGNFGYVYALVFERLGSASQSSDFADLLSLLRIMSREYGTLCQGMVRLHMSMWERDALLYSGCYDEAWNVGRGRPRSPGEARELKKRCSTTTLDGRDLLDLLGPSALTAYGISHADEIAAIASESLLQLQDLQSKDILSYFLEPFHFGSLTERDFKALSLFYPRGEIFEELKRSYLQERKRGMWLKRNRVVQAELFEGTPFDCPSPLEEEKVPPVVEQAFLCYGGALMRVYENSFRRSRDLPDVGQGFISEKELFLRLRERYPAEEIKRQVRTCWLAPQHLDIYFPQRAIAIEYQGRQHYGPLEHFGGEGAFARQQERDYRKQELCRENGIPLILVDEDYSFEELAHLLDELFLRLPVEKIEPS
jgi:hypothetical protein